MTSPHPSAPAIDPDPQRSFPRHPCAPGLALRAAFTALIALGLLWSVPQSSDAQILGNDALFYAAALDSGSRAEIVSAHHPLTQLLAWGLLGLGRGVGMLPAGHGGALEALRWISALGAGACAAWLWAFGTRRLERASGLALALGFAVSAGNWLYGAVGETYLPALFASAGLLATLIEARLAGQPAPIGKGVLWLTLACALRQDAVLVVPAVWLLAGFARGLWILSLAGAASLLLYLGFHGLSGVETPFLPWLRGLADTGLWGAPPDLQRLGISLAVQQHALNYALRHPATAWLSYGSTALAALGLLWLGRGAALPAGAGRALLALGLFALTRLLFFTWWQPGNMEYHTGTWLPLFLAAALWLERGFPVRSAPLRAGLISAWALLLLACNWTALIGPLRSERLAERVRAGLQSAGPGALLVALDGFADFMLLRDRGELPYQSASAWISGGDRSQAPALLQAVREHLASGRCVLLLREADLMAELGFPAHPLDPAALGELTALGGRVERLEKPASGARAAEPFALVLRP